MLSSSNFGIHTQKLCSEKLLSVPICALPGTRSVLRALETDRSCTAFQLACHVTEREEHTSLTLTLLHWWGGCQEKRFPGTCSHWAEVAPTPQQSSAGAQQSKLNSLTNRKDFLLPAQHQVPPCSLSGGLLHVWLCMGAGTTSSALTAVLPINAPIQFSLGGLAIFFLITAFC